MPRFIKLKLNGLPKDEDNDIQWRLVIDNKDDLDQYHELDAEANMECFLHLERNKDGSIALSHTAAAPVRGIAMQRMLDAVIHSTPEGEKIYPIFEVAKYTDKKYLGMLRYIQQYGAIQINSSGGYCGLQSFIDTWDAEIIEDIQKEKFGFPTDEQLLLADTIVLENSHKEYCSTGAWSAKKYIQKAGIVKTIYNLKEIDSDYIFQSLQKCKNVFISTELQDDKQLDGFMKMFLNLPAKDIYLKLSADNVNKIKSHYLFHENNRKHFIHFVN